MSQPPNSSSGPKWNLIIDVAKSVHGNNIVLAAKDEYVGNDFPGYSAPLPEEGADIVRVTRKVRGESPVVDAAYLVQMCNHCDNAPCQKAGGDAVRKRDDGIVLIDPVKAKGRKDIVEACPYGAVIWNEELQLPQHWTFDAHLLDNGWSLPRCVDVCPGGAVEAVRISDADMQQRVEAEGLEVLMPELGAEPRVYYRNLYRFEKCFVGATIIVDINGVEECVAGASVKLFKGAEEIGSATTDEYGEFKIDKLEPNSGAYKLEVRHAEHGAANAEAEVVESVYIGELKLT